MRRIVSLGLLCAALVPLAGCNADGSFASPFDAAAASASGPAVGAPTSISGTSAARASAWTTPPPPGYRVQRPAVVAQPIPRPRPVTPTLPPAPPATAPMLPTQPPEWSQPAAEAPSWTPPAPPPVEEAPQEAPGAGSGCGGGGKG